MQKTMVYVPYEDFLEMAKAQEKVEIMKTMLASRKYSPDEDIAAVLWTGLNRGGSSGLEVGGDNEQ